MIAEDELLVAKVLKLMLEQKSYEVRHVVDEDGAVEAVNEFIPDLIIMDMYLKNKSNGLNAGKRIRDNKIETPIIFTTGNSYQQTKEEIKPLSNTFLFIKPIDVDQLITFIKESF